MKKIFIILIPSLCFGSYNRSDWPHWEDMNNNCRNTRHEVLAAQSIINVEFTSDKKCKVKSGRWIDYYSGEVFEDPRKLQIDHIIPLSWANSHGGENWSHYKKKLFANDPENLIAVSGHENQSKGNKGPDEWLPPNKKYQCEYVVKWNYLLVKYQLIHDDSILKMARDICDSN